MSRFLVLLLSILTVSCSFRIMSFNIRERGERVNDGLRKVATQIKNYQPDIIALQETNESTVPALLKYLGSGWSGVTHCKGHIAALSRHRIAGLYEHVTRGFNVRVYLNTTGQEISFWAYDSTTSPNYAPLDLKKGGATVETLLSKEKERVQHIIELIQHPEFVRQIKNSDSVPVIVAGCMESPSHLDWIESTKKDHWGFVVNWPLTRLLSGAAGLTDSYREVYPDPTKNPGNTWGHTALPNTPHDRIDYIFYRGSLKPTGSYAVHGTSTLVADNHSSYKNNEWPSDHDAIITDFEPTWQKHENKPSLYVGEFPNVPFKAIEKCPLKIHN